MLQEAAITEPRPPRSARGREHSAKTPRMIIPRFSAAQRGAYRWGAAGVARWMVAGRPRAMSTGFDFLAADTVAHFQEHGFVKVDQFWDEEELQALRAGLTYLQSTGRLANVACEGDGVTHTEVPRNLQLCPLSPELPLFRSLPFHPKVQSAVTQLLTESADESVYCYLSQTFWKPPKHGLGTGWHQDNAYFLIDDEHAHKGCAMWTAIHDAKIENGTLRVAPGYQHQLLEHVRDGSSDHHITCDSSIKPSDELSLEVPAGGVVFFNFNTPHTTGENQTDHPRAAVAYHFLSEKIYKFREFPLPEDVEYVTPIVSGPAASGGVAEYGMRVDSWAEDMQAAIGLEAEIENLAATGAGVAGGARVVKQDR